MKPKPLVFLMGPTPVFLPVDRLYARGHYWAAAVEGGYRFGLSAYGVRLLGEIQHLEWTAAEGSAVAAGEAIGAIEGSKATSDLYARIAGRIERSNDDVRTRPRAITTNLYDSGWLLAIGLLVTVPPLVRFQRRRRGGAQRCPGV